VQTDRGALVGLLKLDLADNVFEVEAVLLLAKVLGCVLNTYMHL
jgi:hypothetical protein